MKATEGVALSLEHRQCFRVGGARGTRVRCTAGELWITRHGDAGDVILGTGESWTAASGSPLLVQALGGPARMTLAHAARAPAGRLARLLERLGTRMALRPARYQAGWIRRTPTGSASMRFISAVAKRAGSAR